MHWQISWPLLPSEIVSTESCLPFPDFVEMTTVLSRICSWAPLPVTCHTLLRLGKVHTTCDMESTLDQRSKPYEDV